MIDYSLEFLFPLPPSSFPLPKYYNFNQQWDFILHFLKKFKAFLLDYRIGNSTVSSQVMASFVSQYLQVHILIWSRDW